MKLDKFEPSKIISSEKKEKAEDLKKKKEENKNIHVSI
jgi:hypothetical protein